MEKAFVSGQQTRFSPPNRGLSLGWRLALSTVLIISLVMGGISIGQQLLELKEERQMHEELLKMSLAPLAVRMEAAMNLETMVREVEEFHTAYSKKGYPVHEVVLLDAAKEPVFFTGVSADGENSVGYLQATMPIFSSLLDGGKGALLVLKDSEKYRNTVRRDWLLWAVHFTVTVGVVFLFLAAAIYFQVTKPVNRLVRCVKKMEMGYWRPIELTGGRLGDTLVSLAFWQHGTGSAKFDDPSFRSGAKGPISDAEVWGQPRHGRSGTTTWIGYHRIRSN